VGELDDADGLLHQLRIRGTVPDAPSGPAAALVSAGFAVDKRGMVLLTPAVRAAADERFSLAGEPDHEHVVAAYERFKPLNQRLLTVCTDWQVRPGGVPNDHADATYDWGVIDRLTALDEQAGPVARSLGRRIARFAPYRERMRTARRRVEDGETDWFLSPRIDSYHTVWMQWHEDLLLGLGVNRADEAEMGTQDG
jgi:pyruvate, orthophosphate dikinase